MIDGKQCNIVWYVDDNTMSHEDPNMVTDILEEIKKHFGDLVISRGDIHDFLGINIKISNDKNVELMTKHKIEDTVIQFNDICDFKVTPSCENNVWDVNYEAELLDDVKADLFHSLKYKLLYITERTRTYTEPDVSFLTTRVAKSNVYDWKKIIICISYLNQRV